MYSLHLCIYFLCFITLLFESIYIILYMYAQSKISSVMIYLIVLFDIRSNDSLLFITYLITNISDHCYSEQVKLAALTTVPDNKYSLWRHRENTCGSYHHYIYNIQFKRYYTTLMLMLLWLNTRFTSHTMSTHSILIILQHGDFNSLQYLTFDKWWMYILVVVYIKIKIVF